jgi:hypothetical protein
MFMDAVGDYDMGMSLLARWTQSPANGYEAILWAGDTTHWYVRINRYNSGSLTTLVASASHAVASAISDWKQFRLSCTNEDSTTVINIEWFNSSDWEIVYSYGDTSGSRITTTGKLGFGFLRTSSPTPNLYIDEVQISPLTFS